MALAGVLFSAEIAHYVITTDLGAIDRMDITATQDPRCKPLGSKYDFSCPFPGFNTVQITCMVRGCGDRNLSLPPTTDATRNSNEASDHADKVASLAVEAPYSAGNPAWQQAAKSLISGKDADVQPEDIRVSPRTLEEAQRVVQQRSLALTRNVAKDWLAQHGK